MREDKMSGRRYTRKRAVDEKTPNLFMLSRDLAIYTIQITENPKVFQTQHQGTTSAIVALAVGIHVKLWTANNIDMRTDADIREGYQDRRNLQNKAKAECTALLAMIDIAKGLYHLSGKRVLKWSNDVKTIRSIIQSWKESDAERFGGKAKAL